MSAEVVISVEFSEPELTNMVELIDLAIRAQGTQAARAGLPITEKLVGALQAQKQGAKPSKQGSTKSKAAEA